MCFISSASYGASNYMSSPLEPIGRIAEKLQINQQFVEPWGSSMAKLRLELLGESRPATKRKLILVTAMTSTSNGEGKTVTSIGLAQALEKIGKKTVATLREPSLGPVFGLKGGATGGGQSQVLPRERINLHFTGDFHALTSAHNLLAAMLDAHIHHGNELRIDVNNIQWPRALDMNDRALRTVATGLGGRTNGPARETRFVITAASEIMAVLALASDRRDLQERLGRIVVGFDLDGKPVCAEDVKATGGMLVLLTDAIMPNLVQTTEHTPAILHAGPFANIAHGTSSVLAQKMGLHLADYVVNETGFASDLGAEKYFDIVMPSSGLRPSASVLIASTRSLLRHGANKSPLDFDAGFANLAKHLENMRNFGIPTVVAINRFTSDTSQQLDAIMKFCRGLGVVSAISEVYEKGGAGGVDLAEKVVAATDNTGIPRTLYEPNSSLFDKITTVATTIYGAGQVVFESAARKKLERFTELGYGHLSVCMAKTQASLTDDPTKLGAPQGWTLKVSDAQLSAGAGFVVAVLGEMMLMPGLGKSPQAFKLNVDDTGNIQGMI
jgi:formate--tetrahydrofolate ligase